MVRCRHICVAAMSYGVMTAGAIVVAAEDDFVQTSGSANLQSDDAAAERVQVGFRQVNGERKQVRFRIGPINGKQRVLEVIDDVNPSQQIDGWVFGIDSKTAELKMRELIERRVRQISNRYGLSSEKRRKLTLLANADLYRVLNEAERLRRRCQRFADDAGEMAEIRREADLLRHTHTELLVGVGSFFSKSARAFLENDPIAIEYAELSDSQFLQSFSHIENAIRAIEVVALQPSQRDQLVDLLLSASRSSMVASRDEDTKSYDDDIAKYRLSMIPEQTMLSILSQEQWREIRPLLDGYRTFGPWLTRRGLIEPSSEGVSLRTLPDATQSADAATPANRLEN